MKRAAVATYCDRKRGAVAEYPFGPQTRVYKAGGKVFALLGDASVSLKCDPVLAEMLRHEYAAITPGYHLNKRHWNTVALDASVPSAKLREMVDDSYALIVASLTKKQREAIAK